MSVDPRISREALHLLASSPPSVSLSLSLSLAFITVCSARSRTRVRRPGMIARSGVNDVNRFYTEYIDYLMCVADPDQLKKII